MQKKKKARQPANASHVSQKKTKALSPHQITCRCRWERCASLALVVCGIFFAPLGLRRVVVSVRSFPFELLRPSSLRARVGIRAPIPHSYSSKLSLPTARHPSVAAPSNPPTTRIAQAHIVSSYMTAHLAFPSFGCPASWPFSISAIMPSKALPTFSL
jgi:hypothetical protein